MLRSDLYDYSDAYVWVKGKITVTNPNDNANFNKELTLKNNAPFISSISKINGELVENAEDLDIVIPMYNLLEYSKNFEKNSGSLFNYYRDEPSETTIGASNNSINISITNSKSFIRKNIFACLFSVHNTISLSRHEQVCLMRLRFERYFSHHRVYDGRSISRNVASLNILVHDVINLLYQNLLIIKLKL